jgi:hypothetical protein
MKKFMNGVFEMKSRNAAQAYRLKRICQAALVIALAGLALGCKTKSGSAPASLFPESGEVSGWARSGEVRTFDAKGLWEYIDGDAERYIQAGVSKTLTSDYRYQDKVDVVADIYQMSAPAGAQKIFSTESSTDSQPVQVGDEGRLYKSSLVFRKGSCFVRLTAYEESPEVSKGLVDLARGIESRLGKAGA